MNLYFNEIKNRMSLVLFAFIFSFLISYSYKETTLFLLVKSCINFSTLKTFYMISTNLTDIFTVYIKLSVLLSLQLALFFALYQVIAFLTPGLYKFELKKLVFVFLTCLVFFCFSLLVLNYCILPFSWEFFSSFQSTSVQTIDIFFEANILEYFNFYAQMYLSSIMFGQFFVAIFIIIDSFHNKLNLIKNYRKFIYITFVIISTLITPPDIISQIVLSVTFILLYEFLIVIIIVKNYFYN